MMKSKPGELLNVPIEIIVSSEIFERMKAKVHFVQKLDDHDIISDDEYQNIIINYARKNKWYNSPRLIYHKHQDGYVITSSQNPYTVTVPNDLLLLTYKDFMKILKGGDY